MFTGIYCRCVSECRIRVLAYNIITRRPRPNMAVIGIIIVRQIYMTYWRVPIYTRMTYVSFFLSVRGLLLSLCLHICASLSFCLSVSLLLLLLLFLYNITGRGASDFVAVVTFTIMYLFIYIHVCIIYIIATFSRSLRFKTVWRIVYSSNI